jgi:glutathione S-transferase
LLEKGIPYEDQEINFSKREHKSPEFMKLQPFGVVPVLDDDGYLLYGDYFFLLILSTESRAIVRYLEKKYQGKGTELIPTDLKAYGIAEQGAYLESQVFDPPISALLGELHFRK